MIKVIKAKIIETNLRFGGLSRRSSTSKIVIHHTGSVKDVDFSAARIHEMHLGQGWAGIGYHLVVRKDGTIERGRPIWSIGSHAQGHNSNSIGIHLCGDFNAAYPTDKQIESAALLIANLCADYDIPIDRNHIIGHDECYVGVGNTDGAGCPGRNLQNQLDTISDKANWYRYNSGADVVDTPAEPPETFDVDIDKIAVLARKYESNGDPACVADNAGDLGGVSYGLYQFASKVGAVDAFVKWLCNYPDAALANYGKVLAAHKVNSDVFIKQWKELGTIDPGNFGRLQDEYIKAQYYDVAAKKLIAKYFNVNKHTDALKAVVLSRAVQNGASGCAKLFEIACERLGQPNLSYLDDGWFDGDLIGAIYDYLIVECDLAKPEGNGIWRSPDDFCHGSKSIIAALRSRFVRERADALAMLTGGFNYAY